MTSKTLLKARTIYKAGGVERVGVNIYRVTSTSGEEYGVVLAERAVCTCPSKTTCSHIAAAEISGPSVGPSPSSVWATKHG